MAVLHAQDVPGAQEGGADRLALAPPGRERRAARTWPPPRRCSRSTDLPVRILLRLNDSYTTTGGEFTRLVGLAEEYSRCGAEGVVFGFLDSDLEVDVGTCEALAKALPGVPWTFHRAVDADPRPARAVAPAGDAAGADRGPVGRVEPGPLPGVRRPARPGLGRPGRRAAADARAAACWPSTCRGSHGSGVTQFHVGTQVRPGQSTKSYVDAEFVRSWRRLLDSGGASGAS